MRNLIIIRHSNSKLDQSLPPDQWGLTEGGRLRCITLADRLESHNPGVILTSVEQKARETGEIVARSLGLSCRTVNGIHEHKREAGRITTQAEFRSRVEALFKKPGELIFGLETAHQALTRFSEAILSIMGLYPDQNVAIITHGTVMSLYYGVVTGKDAYQFWRQLGLPAFYMVSWPDLVVLSQVMQIET
jgi:broad specificity phosphatase PhoE